jgi:hypothetical protein
MKDTYWKKPNGKFVKIGQLRKSEIKQLEKEGWRRFITEEEFLKISKQKTLTVKQ